MPFDELSFLHLSVEFKNNNDTKACTAQSHIVRKNMFAIGQEVGSVLEEANLYFSKTKPSPHQDLDVTTLLKKLSPSLRH
jgi:hypothetical protein